MARGATALALAALLPGLGRAQTTEACVNPTCSSPPCAASLLGDVGCTSVEGTALYDHELVKKGEKIAANSHIFGPFEAGFTSKQANIIRNWGCSDPSVAYDTEGGTDIGIAERRVAALCGITFPRIEGDKYIGVIGHCGGHTHDYHFHARFACLYSESGGHSPAVGDVANRKIYGKWEDYANGMLPYLDACGGHVGPTPESPSTNVYHYHVQDKAPFTVGCHGPNANGGLVTVQQCRDLYTGNRGCDNDGGSGTAITIGSETVTYDRFCPCFDAAGSNMGTNIQELPAIGAGSISYKASGGTTSSSTSGTSSTATSGSSSTGTSSSTSTGGNQIAAGAKGISWATGPLLVALAALCTH